MNTLIEELVAAGPVITDGAWGTELQARGLEIGSSPDAWNLSHPELVEEVAWQYIEAGSKVILTNTFGANRMALARYGLADRVVEINRIGAAISSRAAAGKAWVFASIGPTRVRVPEEISIEKVSAVFREQAFALAEGGAEALIVETMSDLEEAQIAVEAAQETGLPVAACMAFGCSKGTNNTIRGVTPQEAAEKLTAAGVEVIGVNCGIGPGAMISVCRELYKASKLPLWVKPNAGLPELIHGRAVYSLGPEQFARETAALYKAGARFLGGCCGTNAAYIRAIQQSVRCSVLGVEGWKLKDHRWK